VKCLDCTHWDMRSGDPKMARLGFAVCKVRSMAKGHTFAGLYERDCEHFLKAAQGIPEKRLAWMGVAIG
jgi:hypothetical protein